MKSVRSLLALGSAAVFLTSCAGIGFDAAWNRAVADYESGKSSEVSGPWTGIWLSHHNHHTGDLRCLVTEDPRVEDGYRFRYHATWGKFFRGGFNAKFPVEPDGGGYSVKGSESLGPFGDFDHDGRIEGDRFDATFKSSLGDHGVFEMARPPGDS